LRQRACADMHPAIRSSVRWLPAAPLRRSMFVLQTIDHHQQAATSVDRLLGNGRLRKVSATLVSAQFAVRLRQ